MSFSSTTFDLAQDALDAAVIDIEQILEEEHQAFDFACQLGVVLFDALQDQLGGCVVAFVEDVGHRFCAAHRAHALGDLGLGDLLDDVLHFRQKLGGHLAQRGHPVADIMPQVVGKFGEYLGSLIGGEVGEDEGDSLGVFFLQETRKLLPVGLLQHAEALDVGDCLHLVQDIGGLGEPERVLEQALGVVQPSLHDILFRQDHLVEFLEHVVHKARGHPFDVGNLHSDILDLFL